MARPFPSTLPPFLTAQVRVSESGRKDCRFWSELCAAISTSLLHALPHRAPPPSNLIGTNATLHAGAFSADAIGEPGTIQVSVFSARNIPLSIPTSPFWGIRSMTQLPCCTALRHAGGSESTCQARLYGRRGAVGGSPVLTAPAIFSAVVRFWS